MAARTVSVPTVRRVFDRQAYSDTTTTNLMRNGDFRASSAGVVVMPTTEVSGTTVPYWRGFGMPSSGTTFAQTQAELIDFGGKRYLKMDMGGAAADGAVRGRMAQTVSIPTGQVGVDLEVSFLAFGYVADVQLNARQYSVNAYIDPAHPQRLSFIVPADLNTGTTLTVYIMRPASTALVSGQYVAVGEVRTAKATSKFVAQDIGLPAFGANYQFNLVAAPDWDKIRNQLQRYKEVGGLLRVWFGIERATVSNYDSASPAVWASLNEGGAGLANLDRFMRESLDVGVKIIPTLLCCGSGQHPSIPYMDQTAVADGYAAACGAIVERYANYPQVAAWDLSNEGWWVWATVYASKVSPSAYLSYAGFRHFQEQAYAAIKAASPNAKVMVTSGYRSGRAEEGRETFIAPEGVCDVVGYSVYVGQQSLTAVSGTPIVNQISTTTGQIKIDPSVSYNLTEGAEVYVAVSAGSSLGSVLAADTPYYVVNPDAAAGTFYLATSVGGAAITAFTGASGTVQMANTDASWVEATIPVYEHIANHQRLPYIASEIGAPNNLRVNGLRPYQTPTIQAAFLAAYPQVLDDYGFASALIWDDAGSQSLFNADATEFTVAGEVGVTNAESGKGYTNHALNALLKRIEALEALI